MPPQHAATRRRGCPSRLGARVISPVARGTRGYEAGRTFFGQKKIKPTTLHLVTSPPHAPRAPYPTPNPYKQTTPHKPHTRAARAHKPQGPQTRAGARAHARGRKKQKKIPLSGLEPESLG